MTNPFELIDARLSNIEGLLLEIKHKPAQKTEPKEPKLLTRKEAARKLGISLVTLNRRTNEGTLTSYNIGGRVLYREDELENALTENHKQFRS